MVGLKRNQKVQQSGPMSVSGDLSVSGATTLSGDVALSGELSASDLGQVDLGSDASLGSAATPNTNVALTFDRLRPVRHARLTLTDFVVSVDEGDDFGGTKLCDLPDSNVMILAVEADVTMVKGGVTNGLEAAVDLDVGIGTAVASAQTLATTMIDVIEKVDVDTDALSVAFQAHTQGQSTAATPIKVADGASSALYLNVGVPAGITASDALTCAGTVDLFYVDLGNVTS